MARSKISRGFNIRRDDSDLDYNLMYRNGFLVFGFVVLDMICTSALSSSFLITCDSMIESWYVFSFRSEQLGHHALDTL